MRTQLLLDSTPPRRRFSPPLLRIAGREPARGHTRAQEPRAQEPETRDLRGPGRSCAYLGHPPFSQGGQHIRLPHIPVSKESIMGCKRQPFCGWRGGIPGILSWSHCSCYKRRGAYSPARGHPLPHRGRQRRSLQSQHCARPSLARREKETFLS